MLDIATGMFVGAADGDKLAEQLRQGFLPSAVYGEEGDMVIH